MKGYNLKPSMIFFMLSSELITESKVPNACLFCRNCCVHRREDAAARLSQNGGHFVYNSIQLKMTMQMYWRYCCCCCSMRLQKSHACVSQAKFFPISEATKLTKCWQFCPNVPNSSVTISENYQIRNCGRTLLKSWNPIKLILLRCYSIVKHFTTTFKWSHTTRL